MKPQRPAILVSIYVASVASAGLVVGLVVGGEALTRSLPFLYHLPPAAFLAILLILVASPWLLRSWKLTLGVLLVWLVIEDLLRKLSGNDIRVYFIKDLIYLELLVGMLLDHRARGAWRKATGRAQFPLYAMAGWAVVMAIPVLAKDWRLPVVGLRVDFFYIPLVVAGFLLARKSTKYLARALSLIALLGGIACAIGLVQAVVGPKFLAPSGPTPGLIHLVLLRGLGTIYEPTGTFVDAGRYGSMAVIAVGVSAAAFILSTGRGRVIPLVSLVLAATAVWVSGGRGNLVYGAVLLALAVLPFLLSKHRRSLEIISAVGLVMIVVVVAAAIVFPQFLTSRFAWYMSTLNPLSSQNELAFRWHLFTSNLESAIGLGKWTGMGTGQESLGKQYLYGGKSYTTNGLYHIEGGYAGVIAEWGVVGLLFWLTWTMGWFGRQLKIVLAQLRQPAGHAGLVLAGWIFIFLFLGFVAGFQEYQNYLANAYFWLLSGVVFGMRPVRVHQIERDPAAGQSNGSSGGPTHVLVLTTDPSGLGGIQQVTRTLISSLADLYGRDRVGLLQVWNHGDKAVPCQILYQGTRAEPGSSVSLLAKAGYFRAAIRSARRWRDRKLVLIATHVHLAPLAWAASRISGRPYVVWCHGLESWGPLRFGARLALRNAAAVFTSNQFTAVRVQGLAGLGRGNVRIFPYGLPLDYKSISSSGTRRPTVLAVARLAPEDSYKGIDTLICAWPQVSARVPDAQLEIVGDGPDRPRLMKIADTLSINGSVHFAGRVSDAELHEAYVRATVFAMPGRHSLGPPAHGEGFGMVFVEAGAAGLPVVAGRAAGAVDAVEHEQTGLLVDPDDPGEVANAIVRLLTDPELAARLGQGGQDSATGKFSYGTFKQNVGILVESVASASGRHAPVTTK